MTRKVIIRNKQNNLPSPDEASSIRDSNDVIFTKELNQQEINTLEHALRVLTHNEIIDTLSINNQKVPKSIRKYKDLVNYVNNRLNKQQMPFKVYESLREKAFNPELNTTDGYFMTYIGKTLNLTEENLIRFINQSNKEYSEDGSSYKAVINKLSFSNYRIKLLISRIHYRYVFDKNSMFSTKYVDETKIVVEIDFNKQIVFFQTSNITKFRAIKTIVRNFLALVTGEENLRLTVPRLSQTLNMKLEENKAVSYSINPSTIKLLDLLMQLENETTQFTGFECKEIVFDHKDSKKKNRKERIDRQGYGGGDLLKKEDVKKLVLENRDILEIEFMLEYKEEISEGQIVIHAIVAGIINKNNDYFRIYIKNNNLTIKNVLRKAYSDLKEIFIKHYSDNTLKSDEKIKNLLGI